MNTTPDTSWHFPVMILASLLFFFLIIRIVIGGRNYYQNKVRILILGLVVIIFGMLFGKYGIRWGLPWWIYYPVPMLMNVLLPPYILKMNSRQTIFYLILSFLSAPVIHITFSLLLGWTEYMPFWKIT